MRQQLQYSTGPGGILSDRPATSSCNASVSLFRDAVTRAQRPSSSIACSESKFCAHAFVRRFQNRVHKDKVPRSPRYACPGACRVIVATPVAKASVAWTRVFSDRGLIRGAFVKEQRGARTRVGETGATVAWRDGCRALLWYATCFFVGRLIAVSSRHEIPHQTPRTTDSFPQRV